MSLLFGRADGGDRARVRLADDDGVDDARERHRVRERQRAAGDDERMALVTLASSRGDVRGVEHAHEAGDLELVRDAEGEHRQVLDGPHRLVGHRVLRLVRRVGLALVVEKGALAGEPRRLHEGAVDALVAERAHPGAVRRRVTKRDRERRLLLKPTYLIGQPVPFRVALFGGNQSIRPCSYALSWGPQPRVSGAPPPPRAGARARDPARTPKERPGTWAEGSRLSFARKRASRASRRPPELSWRLRLSLASWRLSRLSPSSRSLASWRLPPSSSPSGSRLRARRAGASASCRMRSRSRGRAPSSRRDE